MKKFPIEYVDTRKKYMLFKNDCGVTDMTRREEYMSITFLIISEIN